MLRAGGEPWYGGDDGWGAGGAGGSSSGGGSGSTFGTIGSNGLTGGRSGGDSGGLNAAPSQQQQQQQFSATGYGAADLGRSASPWSVSSSSVGGLFGDLGASAPTATGSNRFGDARLRLDLETTNSDSAYAMHMQRLQQQQQQQQQYQRGVHSPTAMFSPPLGPSAMDLWALAAMNTAAAAASYSSISGGGGNSGMGGNSGGSLSGNELAAMAALHLQAAAANGAGTGSLSGYASPSSYGGMAVPTINIQDGNTPPYSPIARSASLATPRGLPGVVTSVYGGGLDVSQNMLGSNAYGNASMPTTPTGDRCELTERGARAG